MNSGGYLLDTNVFLWANENYAKVSPEAKIALAEPSAPLYVSVASLWEMQIKHGLGKLFLPDDIDRIAIRYADKIKTDFLAITLGHVGTLYRLPMIHRDPFDRMLIAQALAEGLTIVSPDPVLREYGAPVLW
ncbi:PilT-like protein [Fimbriimonas ginsengisoli Gsoil 348]|uniref:PilT-like protein n=1 Tax=Fimbriimonas ginsengisoli Gsoil 348 TaxID=661478 RepID=A0A068NJ14_FIMGI|nr:PilT-like protein [Fimbriimonas ginsengisoli Gsoil 348]